MGEVWNVKVQGEEKEIGTTGTHPFYSMDRLDFVPVNELVIGEAVLTESGVKGIEGIAETRTKETVYNIEVDGEHCYRVGYSGVLVHNASTPSNSTFAQDVQMSSKCNACTKTKRITRTILGRNGEKFVATVDIGVDSDGKPITYGDVEIKDPSLDKGAETPVVCRVLKLEGKLLAKPPAFGKTGKQRNAMLALLIKSNTDKAAINPESFNAGHLIAEQNGGPDSVFALVPMEAQLNQSGSWRSMEEAIHGCLYARGMKSATMTVSVMYDNGGLHEFIPSGFKVIVLFEQQRGPKLARGGPELLFQNKTDGRMFTYIFGNKSTKEREMCITDWMTKSS